MTKFHMNGRKYNLYIMNRYNLPLQKIKSTFPKLLKQNINLEKNTYS